MCLARQTVRSRRLFISFFLLAAGICGWCSPGAAQDPSQVGQWSAPQTLPYRPIHAQLLPTGKVMFWDSYENADIPQLWDPSTGLVTPASRAGYNIFCTSFSLLPDGRLLVLGGHTADYVGLPTASIYDPFADSWVSQPDMNAGR